MMRCNVCTLRFCDENDSAGHVQGRLCVIFTTIVTMYRGLPTTRQDMNSCSDEKCTDAARLRCGCDCQRYTVAVHHLI